MVNKINLFLAILLNKLIKLQEENNLPRFLNAYFDVNVNFRQLARATLKIVDCIKGNENLKIPIEFYNQ